MRANASETRCEVCGWDMPYRPCERHVCEDCRGAYFDRLFMRANRAVLEWGVTREAEDAS